MSGAHVQKFWIRGYRKRRFIKFKKLIIQNYISSKKRVMYVILYDFQNTNRFVSILVRSERIVLLW